MFAIIVLPLSNVMLVYVGAKNTAEKMITSIYNIFQRRTPLNKLRARRERYSKERRTGERMLLPIKWVQYFTSVRKSIGVDIYYQKLEIATLCRLPTQENAIH